MNWCMGTGGRARKVPESSGVCWCRFRRQVPEAGSLPVCAIVGSGGRFRKVRESCGVNWCIGTGGRVRKVPESYAVVCCLATLSGAAM